MKSSHKRVLLAAIIVTLVSAWKVFADVMRELDAAEMGRNPVGDS